MTITKPDAELRGLELPVLAWSHGDSMSHARLVGYLGADVNELLKSPSFAEWAFRRSVDEDIPETEVRYVFEGHGFEVNCDETERIRAILLRRGDGEALSDIPFSLSRREVLERFGSPSKSGDPFRHSVLGHSGAWDRFTLATATIHFEYRVDRDEIEMITLMHPDAVP